MAHRRDNENLSDTPFCKDLRGLHIAEDAYDMDNVFLTDQGWVYRHYKNKALTKFWDEIIVAGDVDASDATNAPITEATYSTTGGGSEVFAPIDPTDFETGDGQKDVEYSPDF